MKKIIIPKTVIKEFIKKANLNRDSKGRHVETLCYLLGEKEGNENVVDTILFPRQVGTSSKVNDEGEKENHI